MRTVSQLARGWVEEGAECNKTSLHTLLLCLLYRIFKFIFENTSKLLLNMCSLCGFSQGLAVASALVDISQHLPMLYKEKLGALRNRKQQPPAQPGTCIWCWGQGISVSEQVEARWRARVCREGAGRRRCAERSRAKNWKPSDWKHRLICMFTSFLWQFLPSVLQHLTFYFCIGNNWFNYRSRDDPDVAGGGQCGASERARNDTQVYLWETGLGTVSTVQKTKMLCLQVNVHHQSFWNEVFSKLVRWMNLSSETCYLF